MSTPGRDDAARWLRASTLGWLLGAALATVLGIIWDLTAGGNAQFMVGLGLGAGLGWTQSRALPSLPSRPAWFAATLTGVAMPFVAWDLTVLARTSPLSAPACLLAAGLTSATLQALVQRGTPSASRWITSTILAWAIPATILATSSLSPLPDPLAAPLALSAMTLGGLPLGLITRRALPPTPNPPTPNP